MLMVVLYFVRAIAWLIGATITAAKLMAKGKGK